ncbi:MAG: hypothetical protein IPP94_17385 [Ignavibacteria bacterium]|nr:hypothetical protein [Ignavibacteria bacterium]
MVSVQVLSDIESGNARRRSWTSLEERCNVVLYGNAKTNTIWKTLLADRSRAGATRLRDGADKTVKGSGLFCLFIRPHPSVETACVAVVSGTGIDGMRAVMPLGYLSPGLPFPDLLVGFSDIFTRGEDAIVAAGYFGTNWSVETGDIAWNPALPKIR